MVAATGMTVVQDISPVRMHLLVPYEACSLFVVPLLLQQTRVLMSKCHSIAIFITESAIASPLFR